MKNAGSALAATVLIMVPVAGTSVAAAEAPFNFDHAPGRLPPFGSLAPLVEAQYVPQIFWDSLPPDQMEAWLKAHVPAEMAPQIAKGMDGARFHVAEKVPEAQAYLAAHASHR